MIVVKWIASINAVLALLVLVIAKQDAFGGALLALIGGTISGVVYLLPLVVAVERRHINTTGLGVLNVFLGWTVLGWVGALVWALRAQEGAPPHAGNPGSAESSAMETLRAEAGAESPARPLWGSQTGGAESDSKVCPFCAETIKAAAVRCKHCHADLSAAAGQS